MSSVLSSAARRYAAEFLGTFMLTFAVLVSASGGLSSVTPIIAGFTLMMIVYLLGGISGAHVNPAITLAQLSIRGITLADAVPYIAAQLLGAVAALALGWSTIPELVQPPFEDALLPAGSEALGAFFLSFAVASAASGRLPAGVNGIAVGGSLLLGIIFATIGSIGVLNPAVSIALRLFSLTYLAAPIVGAILGAWAHRLIVGK
jgi:aquaporin Z